MVKLIKRKIKSIIAMLLITISIIILKMNIKLDTKIASVKEEKTTYSIIEIKRGSKIYENSNNSSKEIDISNIKNNNKLNQIELNTKDTQAPNNIDDISVEVLENTVIINFNEPEDKGNNYEYIVENGKAQEKLKFFSQSGLYGYSYKINNEKEDEAEKKVNKIDNAPFIIQNVNWNKDYYLHVRTVDKNNNFSESRTFKINLPSNGVNIEYIDINTEELLASPEQISGMINDIYNANDLVKELSDYTFVETEGALEGLLKKEKINVTYKYAKNTSLNIKYIDKLTGKDLINPKEILGYEGKVINIDKVKINGYICETNINNIKMNSENETISLIYNKVGNIVTSYIDKTTNKKISEDDLKSLSYGSNYKTTSKEFENYELIENPDNAVGTVDNDYINIICYYKPKFKINFKYVDIDTDEVIYEEKIAVTKDNKIKVKLKEIEGYSLIKDSNDEDDTIIDEIIKSLGSDLEKNYNSKSNLTTNEKENIKSEYEIVMNCDDSEYIIYYKKS